MGNDRFKAWTDNLKAFILYRLAAWEKSGEIFKKITDPETAAAHDFEVWDGDVDAFYKRRARISKNDIDEARREYLQDFDDLPLAHKKERVRALIKEFESLLSSEKADSYGFRELRRKVLVSIKDEMGEDALLDALSKSGAVAITLRERLAKDMIENDK